MSGPFSSDKRLFFTSNQIDQICAQALKDVSLLPEAPAPVRIDRFLEKKFGITHEYMELPSEVLGFTRFDGSGPDGVFINMMLDADSNTAVQRRLKSTLAHEAGHILLHTDLFLEPPAVQLSLLATVREKPKILCRDKSELSFGRNPTYNGMWWEYQANMVIGSLLMPLELVRLAVKPYLKSCGILKRELLRVEDRENVRFKLSEIFDVNPAVAKIRIDELYPLEMNQQLPI